MKAKFINEIFTKDSDPIRDLGIGGIHLAKKYEEIMNPAVEEFILFLFELKGKSLKGKFRFSNDIASKLYNVTTGKIKQFSHLGEFLIKEKNKMCIIFTDEEDRQYYYFFADGEKFYVEE